MVLARKALILRTIIEKNKSMRLKNIFAILALSLATTLSAQTSESGLSYDPYPYLFIGLQGGGQTTFTSFDQLKLITPTASVSFGSFFNPTVGARLHVNGAWNKGGINADDGSEFTYKYNYVTTDVDLLLNLFSLFGRKGYSPLNLYLIGGIGLDVAWNNTDLTNSAYQLPRAWDKNLLSHNARIGAMLDYDLCKHWSANIEVSLNGLSDRYNSKTNSRDDAQLTAQLGLAYKFGFKNHPVAAPIIADPEPEPEPVPVVVKEEVKPAPVVVKKAEMRTEIFYAIRETTIPAGEQAKVKQLITFLQDNPDTKVLVTGYADAGTGNPRINMKYSQGRADGVAKALTDAGIEASRITVDAKGDTVQPFSENDLNRVTIAIAQ